MAYNPYQAQQGMYPPQQQGQGQPQQQFPGYPPTQGMAGYPAMNQPGFAIPPQGFAGQQQPFATPYQDANKGYPPQGNMPQGYPPQQQVPGYSQPQNYVAQSAPTGHIQPLSQYGNPAPQGPYPPQQQHGQPGYPGYAQNAAPQQQYAQQPPYQQNAQQQFSASNSQYGINQINNDVRLLREAMKGMGTDEKAIISIVGPRTPEEFQMLCNAYKASYGITLEEVFEKETSGDFAKLLKAIVTPPVTFDAKCLHQAISGMGTDEDLLVEVLVSRPNVEIRMLKDAYRHIYNRDLEQAVASDLSGHTQRLFVALLQGCRDESGQVLNVDQDAEALYKAGEKKIGTDESAFIAILCTRSENHLRSVFRVYEQKYKTDFVKVIKKEFSGSLEKTLISLVNCVNNRPLWAAKLFESSMAGIGTNEIKLTRLATRFRAPGFMQPIKDAYLKEYGKTLGKRISGEVSGDYKKLLLALIGDSS